MNGRGCKSILYFHGFASSPHSQKVTRLRDLLEPDGFIFDTPDLIVFQRTDDSFAHYGASIDVARHQIDLRKIQSRLWRASFAYDRKGEDQLILNGEMDDHKIHLELQLLPMDVFKLTNGPFRWVRPPDGGIR